MVVSNKPINVMSSHNNDLSSNITGYSLFDMKNNRFVTTRFLAINEMTFLYLDAKNNVTVLRRKLSYHISIHVVISQTIIHYIVNTRSM